LTNSMKDSDVRCFRASFHNLRLICRIEKTTNCSLYVSYNNVSGKACVKSHVDTV